MGTFEAKVTVLYIVWLQVYRSQEVGCGGLNENGPVGYV